MEEKVRFCKKCNELTPQADDNTTGYTCQVCFNHNGYSSDNASVVDQAWIAQFWKRKYFEGQSFTVANIQPYGEAATYGSPATVATPIITMADPNQRPIHLIDGSTITFKPTN